jgi:hypothetical protein
METIRVHMSEDVKKSLALAARVALREMSADEFVERHLSGTLRKNKRIGMAWHRQYMSERIAYEFGWAFECVPRSRVMFGDAFTEGDCHSITEAGWFCERHITLSVFPEDRFEVKYISVEYEDGSRREGIGMIVRETSAAFVPNGSLVFAIVAEFDPRAKEWREAKNPS